MRYTKNKIKLLACCTVIIHFLFAQEFDPYSLFPHHEGDVWEYLFLNEDPPDHQQSQILLDSVSNGIVYLETIYRGLNSDFEFNVDYLIDTSYNVWRHDSAWYCCDPVILYKLYTESDQSWDMRNYGNNYFEIGVFDSTYTGVFWGESVTFASFSYYWGWYIDSTLVWTWYTTHILATNFGLVRTYGEVTGGRVLIGAVLNGVLWGDTTYVSITDDNQMLPAQINIINYPNPFNSKTIIRLDFLGSGYSSLKIIDISGRLVYTFWENKMLNRGKYSTAWNGKNNNNESVSSGVYFIVHNNGFINTKKTILLVK